MATNIHRDKDIPWEKPERHSGFRDHKETSTKDTPTNWEERFDSVHPHQYQNDVITIKQAKDFIAQERKEAYEEGRESMHGEYETGISARVKEAKREVVGFIKAYQFHIYSADTVLQQGNEILSHVSQVNNLIKAEDLRNALEDSLTQE